MRIFHVAERQRWEAAKLAGSYAWSTRGRSLEEEGFIHAAHEDQVAGVLQRHYGDHPGGLVLLEIDTERLTSPWREEPVGDETYPHIRGPLNPAAVVGVRDVPTPAGAAARERVGESFLGMFLAEVAVRMGLAVVIMAAAVLGAWVAARQWGDGSALVGLGVGALVGALVILPVARHRARRAS